MACVRLVFYSGFDEASQPRSVPDTVARPLLHPNLLTAAARKRSVALGCLHAYLSRSGQRMISEADCVQITNIILLFSMKITTAPPY
jgi:hypothetical protein